MTAGPAERKPRVVVVDDEANMGKVLTKLLTLENMDVRAFDSPQAAIPYITTNPVDLVLSDLRMPGMSGEEMLDALRAHGYRGEVIMMTAYGTVESAMRCVRAGAFDFITKPFETKSLLVTVRRALERTPSKPAPRKPEGGATSDDKELIGESPEMVAIRDLIRKIAPTESAVVVYGESGTGKELVARAIHRLSLREARRFIAINCASIPENLIESELFGHEKGSFTGAGELKIGLLEAADGGTLFLDEIGELPLALQAKLLRALQEREISRVGSVQSIPVDIRVIAATNRRLSQAVQDGEFREDLYYRLNVLNIKLPPLRKRIADIPLLVEGFLREFRERAGKRDLTIAPEVIARLQTMEWPGNIRELRNYIERLVVLTDGTAITMATLGELSTYESQSFKAIRIPPKQAGDAPPPTAKGEISDILDFREARDQFEAAYLRKVLKACAGNVSEAAKKSGMSRRNFYEKLEKLGINVDEFKE